MEHRKSKNFWLKLACVNVTYSILVGFAVVFWQQNVIPLMLPKGSGMAWVVFAALSSVTIWMILPAVAGLFLLGRYYGLNFFREFWHGRDRPYDQAAQFFTFFTAIASAVLATLFIVLPVMGGELNAVSHVSNAVGGSMIGAILLTNGIVLAERARAGETLGDAGEAGAA